MSKPVKNGSKRCSCSSGETPAPSSATSTRISPGLLGWLRASRRIVPPSGVNLMALASRLMSTSAILPGSSSIRPSVGPDQHGDGLPPQLKVGRQLFDDLAGDRLELRELGVERLAEVAVPHELEHSLDGGASRMAAAPMRSTHWRSIGEAVALCDIFQRSIMPSTTVRGVFSSWLTTSMNAPLTRLASRSLALDA